MTSSVFPDINVWVALTLETHVHHATAWAWYRASRNTHELAFCRFTQLGLLRLLTTESVARQHTLSQQQAWAVYDRWIEDGGSRFMDEPAGLEREFRTLASSNISSPKEWADAYLAAFAHARSLSLITFDRALSIRSKHAVLLSTES